MRLMKEWKNCKIHQPPNEFLLFLTRYCSEPDLPSGMLKAGSRIAEIHKVADIFYSSFILSLIVCNGRISIYLIIYMHFFFIHIHSNLFNYSFIYVYINIYSYSFYLFTCEHIYLNLWYSIISINFNWVTLAF